MERDRILRLKSALSTALYGLEPGALEASHPKEITVNGNLHVLVAPQKVETVTKTGLIRKQDGDVFTACDQGKVFKIGDEEVYIFQFHPSFERLCSTLRIFANWQQPLAAIVHETPYGQVLVEIPE